MRFKFHKPAIVLLLTLSLSGCFSATYTGAASAYNNYSIRQNLSNNWVEMQAINALNTKKTITSNSNIAVSSVNFIVLLTGHAKTNAARQSAINLVKNIRGVRRVVDAITVGRGTSANQSLQDSWITTKIKSQMLVNKYIDSTQIKVITANNGVVFLMGVVPAKMANVALYIARHTNGVRKVVNLMEIVTVTLPTFNH